MKRPNLKIKASLVFPILIYAFVLFSALTAQAKTVVFNTTYTDGKVDLKIVGQGVLYYMYVFKAYSGALYLPKDTPRVKALDDVPKRLVLEYHQSIDAEDFGPATRYNIQRNVDGPAFKKLRSRIDQLNALYQDVKPTDRYSLTYTPGYGTELSLNNTLLGVIKGADFAAAVFSIWIGKKPIDKTFKNKLLGNK